jgi:hypothetical protein
VFCYGDGFKRLKLLRRLDDGTVSDLG